MYDGDQAAVAAPWTSDEPSRAGLSSRLPRALPFGNEVRRALLLTFVWEVVGEGVGLAVPLGISEFVDGIAAIRADYDMYHENCLKNYGELGWDHVVNEFFAFVNQSKEEVINV